MEGYGLGSHGARPVHSNHVGDEVDPDQLIVNKELSLMVQVLGLGFRRSGVHRLLQLEGRAQLAAVERAVARLEALRPVPYEPIIAFARERPGDLI